MRVKAFAAFCLTLLFAAFCALPGERASAQGSRRRTQPAAPQAAAQQPERPKQVIIGRGADTQRGSRMTITSDEALNDYSAYRSGDRFYVELPNANAATAARAAGKGFTDLQVQRRGKNVVLSYRVQPGAKPRVEQRFNRLEVIFEVPAGEAAQAAAQAQAQAQPAAPNPATTQPARPETVTPPAAANQNPPAANRTPETTAAQNAAAQTSPTNPAAGVAAEQQPAAAQNPAEASSTPVEQTAPAAQTAPPQELAQAQPPAQPAPAAVNNAAPQGTGTSVGAFLMRNWPVVLVAVLLFAGIGLLVASRRTATAAPPPPDVIKATPAAKLEEARTTTTTTTTTSATSSMTEAAAAVAPAAAAAVALKQTKKEARKAKKAREAQAAREAVKTPAAAHVAETVEPVAEPVAETVAESVDETPTVEAATLLAATPVEEAAAEETVVDEVAAEETTATTEAVVDEAAVVAEPVSEETVVPVEEKGIESVAPSAEPEPVRELEPVVALDPDHAHAETRLLLDGGSYDRSVLATRDAMARQMIGAELLSALAGRNVERRERALAAFGEFGYFEEKVEDLRTAQASAERSSAARALGLAGDRAATPHLVAALEDDAVEVRRAAVESLASLRDPAAVGALEALLRREKKSKTKVNRKLVEHAIQTCREGVAEETATTEAAAPVVETVETVEAAAPFAEVGRVTPVAESAIEVAPAAEEVEESKAVEAFADVSVAQPEVEASAEVAEEAPAVEERGLEPVVAQESSLFAFDASAAETPAETETLTQEVAAVDEAASAEPAVEEPAAVEEVAAREEAAAPVSFLDLTETVESEPVTAVEEPAALGFEGAEAAEEVAEEVVETRRVERADEWVELDFTGLDATTAAAEAPVFETSGGEAVTSAEPAPPETAAPVAEAADETASMVDEVAVEPVLQAEETLSSFEPRLSSSYEPASSFAPAHSHFGEEKGVAPFDEHSAVPANLQQRLASREPAERAAAVAELAKVDTGEAFHQICAAFDDEARDVRSAAARALYDVQGDRADSFTRALREAGAERRRNIGAAIATSGLASDAISQLTGESREKTYEAFSLLFLMAKAGEVAPLVRAIEGHPNNEVRLAVVKLLALSGQKEILPAFRRLAVRGSLPTEVRSAVMEAIYQISSQSEPTPAA